MPTTVFLQGGGKAVLKGDDIKTAVIKPFFSRYARGISLNGHEVMFFKRAVIFWEFTPEAEAKAAEEAEKKKQEEAALASHCRRCGLNSPREFEFCPKCGAALVKKEGPRLDIPGGRP